MYLNLERDQGSGFIEIKKKIKKMFNAKSINDNRIQYMNIYYVFIGKKLGNAIF